MEKSLLATLGIGALVASCGATPSAPTRSVGDIVHDGAHRHVGIPALQERVGYRLPQPDCSPQVRYKIWTAEFAPIAASFAHPQYSRMFATYFHARRGAPVATFEFRYIDEREHSLTRPFVYGQVQEDLLRHTLDITVTIDQAMDCIDGDEQIQRQHADFPLGTTPVPVPRDMPGSI